MVDYVVGDIQGCYDELQLLLESVSFDSRSDRLLAVGDLVNRGPQSLEILRFCRELGDSFATVLGNHDLHLIAIARGHSKPSKKDTLSEILKAPDCELLINWLRSRPLAMRVEQHLLVHAGVPPFWGRSKTLRLATEVSKTLASDHCDGYLAAMYGNHPAMWSEKLRGVERLRVITNYLTRMRFITKRGALQLSAKGAPGSPPQGTLPWYDAPRRKMADKSIIFGHWAALEGRYCGPNLHALDTGCAWGKQLTLLNLATLERSAVNRLGR